MYTKPLKYTTKMTEKCDSQNTEIPFQINDLSRAFYRKNDITFDPPVYRQRYGQVYTILLEEKWRKQVKKVVDFGCAEFRMADLLKRLESVEELCFVDVDRYILEEHLYRLRPITYNYMFPRSRPLTIKVFAGSITDPDTVLCDTDVVLAIEIIEHLYPDVLEAVPYNIFSWIRPKLAIFTTPNADFNVLFSKMKHGEFRHADHKFEWTRQQFNDWANNLVLRFPEYKVYIIGIGHGPPDVEEVGCCSQMAVFIREDSINIEDTCQTESCNSHIPNSLDCDCNCNKCQPKQSYGICTHHTCSKDVYLDATKDDSFYKLVNTIEYPYDKDTRTPEQRLLDTVKGRINTYIYPRSLFYNEDSQRFEIPLSLLPYSWSEDLILTVTELRSMLVEAGYSIEECKSNDEESLVPCLVIGREACPSDSEEESDEEVEYYITESCTRNDSPVSDWDNEEIPDCQNEWSLSAWDNN